MMDRVTHSQKPLHGKTSMLLGDLASVFDVDVRPADMSYWETTLTVAKALDTLVDDEHKYDTEYYCDRLLLGKEVPYIPATISRTFPVFFEAIAPEQQAAYRRATKLGSFAQQRLAAVTPIEYAETIIAESYLMSDVLQLDNRDDIPERARFNAWLEKFGRASYALDTVSDVMRDRNENNHNLPVNRETVLCLSRIALRESRDLVRVSPLGIYVPILHRGVTKLREKMAEPDFAKIHFTLQKSETPPEPGGLMRGLDGWAG